MAPPIPLPCVAGTLALSFTSGRVAPEPEAETPPIQQPEGIPEPPALPDVPGETDVTAPRPDSTPPSDTTPPPSDETVGTTAPPVSEPAVEPDPVPAPVITDPIDTEEPAPAPKPPKSLVATTDKRFFFNLFVGGHRRFRGAYAYFPGMDFKTELAIGGHGKRPNEESGRWVGGAAVLQVSTGFPFNSFTLAPRLQIDRQILPDYAFYFTTTLTFGYRATTYAGYGIFQGLGEVYTHSAMGAVGWGVSAIVAERMVLSFRPLNVELAVPAPALVDFNWDVLGGLGVVW